jgi:hypothetical protein
MQVLAAPVGQLLRCNHGYSFADNNGTYTIQHACGGSTGPWGFHILPFWCSESVAPVNEHGMSWARNGVGQARQAPHPGSACVKELSREL